MRIKRKKLNLIIIITAALFILSSAALAAYNGNNGNGANVGKKEARVLEMDDNDITNALAEQYGKSRKEIQNLKSQLGGWDKVQEELDKFENSLKLSQERIVELVNLGYRVQDIDQVEELAAVYGVPPEEILELKTGTGKDGNTSSKAAASVDSGPGSKSWDDVRWELDIKRSVRMLGLEPVKAEQMEKNFLAQKQEKKNPAVKSQQDIGNELLLKNKVTDSDITLCKKYGVENDVDCAFAKGMAGQYGVTLEKVLELKKEKGNWNSVRNELEVAASEN